MEIREYNIFDLDEIVKLYRSVGWTNYLNRAEVLASAYENSLLVLGAYEKELVGIIRAVGDGLTIVFIQDIIVLPEYQRKGIGSKLLEEVLKRYSGVYQIELLTDNTEKTKAFYRSAGFRDAGEIDCTSFIKAE